MTKEYTDWYDEVLPDLTGCPTPIALNAIKQAAIKFCHGSRVWKEYVDLITVTATDELYDIPTPKDTEAVRILRGWYEGKELDVLQEEQINDLFPDDWTLQTSTVSEQRLDDQLRSAGFTGLSRTKRHGHLVLELTRGTGA